MLFDQLVRLLAGLSEIVFIVFLAFVFVVGISLLKIGFEGSGLLILFGVAWFVVSALTKR